MTAKVVLHAAGEEDLFPDQETKTMTMPDRVIVEVVPALAGLYANAAKPELNTFEIDEKLPSEKLEGEFTKRANALLDGVDGFELLPPPFVYQHRLVDGVYLHPTEPEPKDPLARVYIVGKPEGPELRPAVWSETPNVKGVDFKIEYRYHVVIQPV